MTTIYIKDADGRKIAVKVKSAVAIADVETRRAAWRNEAKELYYRDPKFQDLNDKDEELTCEIYNPELVMIAAEERAERRAKLSAALKSLTPEQIALLNMLKKGMSIAEIAAKLNVDKSAISHRRKRIQEKIAKILEMTVN